MKVYLSTLKYAILTIARLSRFYITVILNQDWVEIDNWSWGWIIIDKLSQNLVETGLSSDWISTYGMKKNWALLKWVMVQSMF